MNWKGTGVALVTPFGEDLRPDHLALRKLVRHVVDAGVDYLVVLGTTAESVTLNQQEKGQIMRTVAEENAGQLPLMVGIGGNNTLAVAAQLEQTDLSAYDAVLSVSPYYNRPTQEGIYQHFKLLATRCPLPIILYNVPGRTGSNILPQTCLRIAKDCSTIIGVKEASGDMVQIRELIEAAPSSFHIISGDDFTAIPTVLSGGAGVISVIGQAIPGQFCPLVDAAAAGRGSEAMEGFKRIQPLTELIFREGNPAGVKALLSLEGICSRAVRLPLVQASEALVQDLGLALEVLTREKV